MAKYSLLTTLQISLAHLSFVASWRMRSCRTCSLKNARTKIVRKVRTISSLNECDVSASDLTVSYKASYARHRHGEVEPSASTAKEISIA